MWQVLTLYMAVFRILAKGGSQRQISPNFVSERRQFLFFLLTFGSGLNTIPIHSYLDLFR